MLLLVDEEQAVLVQRIRGPFSFQFKDHNTIVVTSSEKIDLGMSCDHPISVILPLESLNHRPFVQIPDPDSFVFADGEDEVLVRVEKTG